MKYLMTAALLLAQVASVFAAPVEVAPGVFRVGTIEHENISESSGLTASRRAQATFWTHNDGGRDVIFAMSALGQFRGRSKIKDVEINDLEDITATARHLYLADIGNNDLTRSKIKIFRIPEPDPRTVSEVSPDRRWTLKYQNGQPFDAEGFFVQLGFGYVVSKELISGAASVFRFPLGPSGTYVLQPRFSINVDGPTGGVAFTSDGNRLGVITFEGAYLFSFPAGLPSDGSVVEPVLFVPYQLNLMEGCVFTRDGLLVTAETREILLFTNDLFKVVDGPKTKVFPP